MGGTGRAQGAITCLLERLGQEEALLHVVVRRVGGVDVLDAGEAPAHPAVLVDGLQGATRQAEDGGERAESGGEGMIKKRERQRNKLRASDKWTRKTKSNEMKRADIYIKKGWGGERGGGVAGFGKHKFLISFQKCALINFFACHRLDPESPGEINTGNSSRKKNWKILRLWMAR